MILWNTLEVFNILVSGILFLLPFSYSYFKNGQLRGASFQHSFSNDHCSSEDLNSLLDS